MEWEAFLREMSIRLRLTPEQGEVFVARLAEENAKASEAKIAAQLSISVAAVKKHMNAAYDRAGQEFPSVAAIEGRGKLKELRACLKQEWKNAPLAPQFWGEPSQGGRRQGELRQSAVIQSPPSLADSGGDVADEKLSRSPQPSPLKPGAPFPRVRLPDNFVERPQALQAVKERLLPEHDREGDKTLVVSAIAGLGGLGKSVLATAIVKDREVQARFPDGILWVTLGQSPDLQTLLGDWIRELDKSRESFSATTLESASGYLHNLLLERRMLLVVDDVWNADHADWFRVGGVGCRVLVTTREARIEGAEYYPLDLMTEEEAIALVRQKLKQWRSEQEAEVKAFARVLGYLPLALDLAANQVRDGLSWAELRSEFEAERKSVALGTGRRSRVLELLDSSEAWEHLPEEKRRKYSLQACFNLSLKRLSREQLQQFAGLGVLPEDVNLNKQMAAVLWNVRPLAAQKVLALLRNRSFLTEGAATLEDEPTYRVHDLMHDMARSLIEEGILNAEPQTGNNPAQNLITAHRQFLERYRECAIDRRWDKLPNDRYIHRHLTWHMEQANWADEVHALMAMSDERGRNAWFEACDRLGQPAIFVEDVARGWRLAEELYEQEPTRAIVLQCRYALIQATLNSLAENLPIGMMAEFVKRGFWTIEQAWVYVEQMQDEDSLANAITTLSPYLRKSLTQVSVEKARSMCSEFNRVWILSNLAKLDAAYFSEALEAARAFKYKEYQALFLSDLVKVDATYLPEALETVQAVQDEYKRANVFSNLAEINAVYFPDALKAAQAIQNESMRAWVLIDLMKLDSADVLALSKVAYEIQDDYNRALVLSSLARLDASYFSEALDTAWAIEDETDRVGVLSSLAELDDAYFCEVLEAVREVQDEESFPEVLSCLARLDAAYFPEALEATQAIQDKERRAGLLSALAKVDDADFAELLEVSRAIQDEHKQAEFLTKLAKLDNNYLSKALEAVQAFQFFDGEYIQAWVLINLAKIDADHIPEALKAVQEIESDYIRWWILSSLAELNAGYFSEVLDAVQAIQDEGNQALVLMNLAKLDSANSAELLEAARAIQNDIERAWVLNELAKLNSVDCVSLVRAAREIQSNFWQAKILSELAKLDAVYFPEALKAARAIQDEEHRALVLSNLAELDVTYFPEALKTAQGIQDKSKQLEVLGNLARIGSISFAALLEAAQEIQHENRRSEVLGNLAKVAPKRLMPNVWEAVATITHKPTCAKALSRCLPYFTLSSLRHPEWKAYLHALAYRTRAELLQDLVTLYPAILHISDKEAMRGVVDSMHEVCSQWE